MFETAVDSFIVRFVREQKPDTGATQVDWYGVIRHVQSNKQMRFTQMDEALSFMDAFIPVAEQSNLPGDGTSHSEKG